MKRALFVLLIIIILPAAAGFGAEKVARDKILTDKAWQQIYHDFTIDPPSIEILKSGAAEDMRIDVYLGFWCSDSRNNVPKFAKIIDEIGSSSLTVNYYSVKRKPSKDIKYFVEELKVERVPTFIFYREGEEIGRIIENPKTSMVDDFLEIIL